MKKWNINQKTYSNYSNSGIEFERRGIDRSYHDNRNESRLHTKLHQIIDEIVINKNVKINMCL